MRWSEGQRNGGGGGVSCGGCRIGTSHVAVETEGYVNLWRIMAMQIELWALKMPLYKKDRNP